MIRELLERTVITVRESDNSVEADSERSYFSPNASYSKVPTLSKGYYQPMSPMLQERFSMFGSWSNATHGDWLSLDEMESLWQDWENNQDNNYIKSLKASAQNWFNDAISLFKPERISVFAAAHYNYERIYLLWFDGIEEPELWVYDGNGLARYQDLSAYLKAFLDDDLSAYQTNWILAYNP